MFIITISKHKIYSLSFSQCNRYIRLTIISRRRQYTVSTILWYEEHAFLGYIWLNLFIYLFIFVIRNLQRH